MLSPVPREGMELCYIDTHTHTLTRRISRNDPGREEAGANKAGGPEEDTQPTARVEMGDAPVA